jgi:hypothetical protein
MCFPAYSSPTRSLLPQISHTMTRLMSPLLSTPRRSIPSRADFLLLARTGRWDTPRFLSSLLCSAGLESGLRFPWSRTYFPHASNRHPPSGAHRTPARHRPPSYQVHDPILEPRGRKCKRKEQRSLPPIPRTGVRKASSKAGGRMRDARRPQIGQLPGPPHSHGDEPGPARARVAAEPVPHIVVAEIIGTCQSRSDAVVYWQ